MAHESSFRAMMDDLLAGNEDVAAQIVQEQTAALVAVARRQIGAKLGRRVDPEDIVQSVYRSFFGRVQRGEYELGNGTDLWKLLVTMVLNKVRRQAKFHRAGGLVAGVPHSVQVVFAQNPAALPNLRIPMSLSTAGKNRVLLVRHEVDEFLRKLVRSRGGR